VAGLLGGDPDPRMAARRDAANPTRGRPADLSHAIYLNLELDDIEDDIVGLSGPVSALVEKAYGIRIAEIEQSIEAVALDRLSARKLRVEPGAPALKATRRR